MGQACSTCILDQRIRTHLVVLSLAITNEELSSNVAILNQQEKKLIMKHLQLNKQIHFDTASNMHVCIEAFHQGQTQNIETNLRLILGKCPPGSQLIEGQGLIIYNSAYYYGQIHQNKAQGTGHLYFLNDLTLETLQLKVQGKWQKNRLVSGNFTNPITKQHLMQIALNASKETAEIVFPCKNRYIGSVKLKDVRNYKQLITGNGKMYFPNGDQYEGSVLNGYMHTETNEEASYTKLNKQIYRGQFKCNQRHGKGLLTFWIGTQKLMLRVFQWIQGRPVGGGTLHRLFQNGEQKSVDLQFNQEGKLSSTYEWVL